MCMTIKHLQEQVRRLPKEFTAYKVVDKRNGNYYPPIMDTLTAIEKHNVARAMKTYEPVRGGGKYKPYYHSFKTQAACDAVRQVADKQGWTFIKIRIKRKDVTCLGGYGPKDHQYLTIISKAYTTEFEEYIPQG